MLQRKKSRFYGIVTVGERGQIVIPQEAREEFEIKAKDKLVVVGAGLKRGGLMIIKAEAMNRFISRHIDELSLLQKTLEESEE
jgi:AbrB family looped-hinge helix DNA binding protein